MAHLHRNVVPAWARDFAGGLQVSTGKQPASLLSGTATYLVSNTVNAAIPFALMPVLTRALGPVQYGQVGMFQMLVAALAAVTGLCVHGAANRKYYDMRDNGSELAEFIGSCLQILAVSTLATLALIWALSDRLAEWSGLTAGWIVAAGVVSAGGVVVNIRLGQWQVRGHARRYGVFQVSQGLLVMLLSLLLVLVLLMGSAGRMLAQLLVVALFAAAALYSLRRDRLASFRWRPGYIREALAFGVPLVPHVAGIFLLGAVDRAVINDILGLHDVGVYMVAVQLALGMAIVFDAVNKAYVPWLFERLQRDQSHEKHALVRWTYVHFALSLLAAGGLALFGPHIVSLVAGPGYEAAAQALGWLALGQAFSGMYLMVTNYVFYSKRTGWLAVATISSGALNVALLLVLVPAYGLRGAGMAFAISMAVRFLFTWALAHRSHPMPWAGDLSEAVTDPDRNDA